MTDYKWIEEAREHFDSIFEGESYVKGDEKSEKSRAVNTQLQEWLEDKLKDENDIILNKSGNKWGVQGHNKLQTYIWYSSYHKKYGADCPIVFGVSLGKKGLNISIHIYNNFLKDNDLRNKLGDSIKPFLEDKALDKLDKDSDSEPCYFGFFNISIDNIDGYFGKVLTVYKELPNVISRDKINEIIEPDNTADTSQHCKASADTKKTPSLNQILYGPPGTGKTYNTVIEAVKICDGQVDQDYDQAKKRYQELVEEGRIEFVTFHQSYGYEEFIEGIKPVIKADDESSGIAYQVEPGVLKRLAREAEYNLINSSSSNVNKVDIELLLNDFAHDIQEEISQGGKPLLTIEKGFKNKSYIGEVKNDSDESFKSFITTGSVKDQSLTKSIILRDYQAFFDREIKGYKDIKPTFKSTKATYHGNGIYYYQLFLVMKEFQDSSEGNYLVGEDDKVLKPYVLIIDEINRGNMSKIFGELITLIEDDKRIGSGNGAMTARLPVSGEEFGVPNNLHIIGTMNTADRSIAMMDTALRRRFEFKERMPDSSLLQDSDSRDVKVDGINIKKVLEIINQRIEVLYDREHTIGHAYFMPLKKDASIARLSSIFENKIIPLLAEYFFEDWEKIRMVLGDEQKGEDHQFITEKKGIDYQKLFGNTSLDYSDERKVYERNPGALGHPESYVGIYQPFEKTENSPEKSAP